MHTSHSGRLAAMGQNAWQAVSVCRSELMGVAMLWVMLFHAYQFHFHNPLLEVIKMFGYLGVDIFILLSGMGLGKSLLEKEQGPLRTFYLRRFQRILPTYWLIVGPYSLLLVLLSRIPLSTAVWNLTALHYWFHIPGSFNWYVPALLAFYLLAPFYVKFFARSKYKRLLSISTLFVSYALYRLCLFLNFQYLEDFIFRIPAFALGVLLGWFLVTKQPATKRDAAWVSAMALVGVVLMVLLATRTLYTHPCYIFSLMIVLICVVLAALLSLCKGTLLCRGLAAIGQRSFEIYLINVLVTREFSGLVAHLGLSSLPVWAAYAVLYVLNLTAAFVLHALVSRLHLTAPKSH